MSNHQHPIRARQILLRRRFRAWWTALPGNTRGALWVLLSCFAFSLMAVCIKILGRTLPVFELVTLRSALALVLIAPALARAGPTSLRTTRFNAHLLRSAFGMGALTSFFLAVTHLELALASTLGFTRNLFLIVLAVLLLGERIRWRRTTATLIGFGGVVICVQPGATVFDYWTLAGLSFALFGAGVTVTVKKLTSTEPPLTIMFWTYVLMGLMALVPALFVWQWPTRPEWLLIVAFAACSAVGQATVVRGLRVGEATAVAPFDYSRLLYAAVLGWLFFGELPAPSTWLGATVIIASTVYIAVREARLRRPAAPPV